MINTAAGAERVSPSSHLSSYPSPHAQRCPEPSSPSPDTTGQASNLYTSTHFFGLCVCNLAREGAYYGLHIKLPSH